MSAWEPLRRSCEVKMSPRRFLVPQHQAEMLKIPRLDTERTELGLRLIAGVAPRGLGALAQRCKGIG